MLTIINILMMLTFVNIRGVWTIVHTHGVPSRFGFHDPPLPRVSQLALSRTHLAATPIDACFVQRNPYRSRSRHGRPNLSPKFQVVIRRAVRERLRLKPGQKVQALVYDGRVELIPMRPAKALRGFLSGIDTSVARDEDRG